MRSSTRRTVGAPSKVQCKRLGGLPPAAQERNADPTRLALAAALDQGGELCVCDAAWVIERAQNLVSHHLRALRDAGLATTRREGRTVFYALTDEGRSMLASVLAEPAQAVG